MEQIRVISKEPHPDFSVADHHKPIFAHDVVAAPDMMPPPMPPPPPSSRCDLPVVRIACAVPHLTPTSRFGALRNAPPVLARNAPRFARMPNEFSTTALISVREQQMRSQAGSAQQRRVNQRTSQRSDYAMAPPPPLEDNEAAPAPRARSRKQRARRASPPPAQGGQVPTFVQLGASVKAQVGAKTQTQNKAQAKAQVGMPRLPPVAAKPAQRVLRELPPMAVLRSHPDVHAPMRKFD